MLLLTWLTSSVLIAPVLSACGSGYLYFVLGNGQTVYRVGL